MIIKFSAVLILVCTTFIYSQQLTGSVTTYLGNLVDEIPGNSGNHYREPSSEEMDLWGEALQLFLDGDLETARQRVDALNYQIVEFLDTTGMQGSPCFIFREKDPRTNYWGTYAFNEKALREELVLQAPHPLFDTNTGKQAIHCFTGSSAGALFLSGTHRCNHSLYSPCDGTTTVCEGTSAPYRISDMAHNVQSIFQKSTEVLCLHNENSVFVQLHGFAKKTDDPYVIMSNGTRITPDHDPLSRIREQLTVIDPVLTFKVAHIDLSWSRLIAFSNTQGRFINGSPDPCYQDATISAGRFVHIEQERTRLRQDESGWEKMLFALSNAFEADTTGTPTGNSVSRIQFSVYPNPTTGLIHIITGQPVTLDLYSFNGVRLRRYNHINSGSVIDLGTLPAGIYLISATTPTSFSFRKIVVAGDCKLY